MGISFKEYCIENGGADLLAQWDVEANLPLTPDTVSWGSHKKLHWRCEKGHTYTAYAYDRIRAANPCPVCSGRRVVQGVNDLASQCPELAQEWHPTKNQEFDLAQIYYRSNRSVWWRCEKGHEWRAPIYARMARGTGCPYCAGRKVLPGETDLKSLHPELMKQWHPTKNEGLDPAALSPGTHRYAWWLCENGHEWKAEIKSRALYGSGCPVCSNKKIMVGVNDLATTHPALAKEWDYEKNGHLTPDKVVSGSERKVWWRCKAGHEWQSGIHSRAQGADCPICSGKKIVEGLNDLGTLYPELMKEWDRERNGPLSPGKLAGQSNQYAWWICHEGHSYKASIAGRTSGKNGCPYCAGRKVLAGFNDLASQDPAVAAQWHPTLNGTLTPEQVTKGSGKYAWWICEEGHVWKAKIYSRTSARRHGCPYCNGRYRKDSMPFVRQAEAQVNKRAAPDPDPLPITMEPHAGEEAAAMRTIIVDGDRSQLQQFARSSKGIRDIQIVGQFESDLEALMYAKNNPVELAFLNISTSSAGGIMLAKELRKIRDKMLIVFTSESSRWLSDANGAGGDYFLIKPYSREKLELAMERIRLLARRLRKELYIQTFGDFQVFRGDKLIPLRGKTKEILALLVTRRGKEITNREIYSTLWPGREYSNRAMSVYYNAFGRLSRDLRKEGCENLIFSTTQGKHVNTELFDCDYYIWKDTPPSEREEVEEPFLSQYAWARGILENRKEPYRLPLAASGR
ncbi:MAG: zinc-ribbon domain-containing protein [Lachnospirales bacterium]